MAPPTTSQQYVRDIASLEARVQNLEKRGDMIEAQTRVLPAMEQEIGRACTTLEKHDRALFGTDGRPGIVGRLAGVEEKMDDQKRLTLSVGIAVVAEIAIQLLRMAYGV